MIALSGALRLIPLLLIVLAAAGSRLAEAAIDNQQTILDSSVATGGAAIASFGYDPTTDTMYVAGFGATGETRKITGVGSGSPTFITLVSPTEQQLYYRDGDPNISVSNPSQSAFMLNPTALGAGPGAIAPYQMAIIADSGFTRIAGSSTVTDPAATKRFYSFNLQQVPPGGDGRDVYTTLATLSDMQAAVGATATTSNQGRQMAWSGDGQSLYFSDSSTAFGGLWKLNPLTGDLARLTNEDFDTTEPAVLSSGGVDTFYSRGHATNNPGGIDKISYDGTTVGPRTTVVTANQLREFFDAGADQTPVVASLVGDSAGNVYFNNTDSTPERRGIFMLDPQGRIVKVVSHAERDVFLGSETPNSSTVRMQPRTIVHPTAGSLTQIMYSEVSTRSITGAYVFEVGDFNRDGDVTSADYAMLGAASVIQTRGGAAIANEDHHRFDLNANSVVDWKDVTILQQFTGFATGDVNFDSVLDLVDLDVLGANYYTTANPSNKTWIAGDLGSSDPLYAPTAVDANLVNAVDVTLFADAWLDLEQPITESQLTSRGYAGQFLADVLDAFGFAGGLSGDFDSDGDVDGADFLNWQTQVGATVTPGTGADANSDGMVDGLDLAEWTANFGDAASSGAAAAIPEPAAAALMTVALAAIGCRRRIAEVA